MDLRISSRGHSYKFPVGPSTADLENAMLYKEEVTSIANCIDSGHLSGSNKLTDNMDLFWIIISESWDIICVLYENQKPKHHYYCAQNVNFPTDYHIVQSLW